ncbi:hypothetical protein CGZ93_17405 [Enemella dayhoffiae]|uniref:Fumarylacetoacetate hydrolase family protein n=1 Tax=Enemella dayhoffiae TaxID=2016507 RepID=A0A255GQ83_9ACTN|nr:fumarylacetoacetate hydrolase family protein [Enemella dayhoffiae]OYO16543.1 hypothetical protein CGZ93_17405 [Enemella dayhoffiae]
MRWIRCATDAGPRTGVLIGDRAHLLEGPTTLVELLATGELAATGDRLADSEEHALPWSELRPLAPLVPPSLRDCVGHLGHIANCRARLGGEVPEIWGRVPQFYFGAPASVTGASEDVQVSPGCGQFDYELEVAVVIGRPGRDLHPERAIDHVAGVLLFCDWSARDLQLEMMPAGLGPGKGKDGATTLGPWLLTVDELADRRTRVGWDLPVSVSLNGVVMGGGNLADQDFTVGEVIAYCSRGVELQHGDVIATGTVPTGCLLELDRLGERHTGPRFERWLQPGDVVELEGGVLGATRNRIVAGTDPVRLPSELR